MFKKYEAKKITIAKKDRHYWYGEKETIAELYICECENQPTQIIIYIDSTDDFSMRYEFSVIDNVEKTYTHIKKYVYDRIPKNVTMDWLLEHSFYFN